MTHVRLGRRKGRFGIQARSALSLGGPPFVPGAVSAALSRGLLMWAPAAIMPTALFMGEAVEMSVEATVLHPAEGYWGDASEMEATGGVVP